MRKVSVRREEDGGKMVHQLVIVPVVDAVHELAVNEMYDSYYALSWQQYH